MWRYLKAAFLVGVDVPALGRLPVNALAAAGFAIMGFADPGFWWLGAGLETLFLFALSTNSRFQKVADAIDRQGSAADTDTRLLELGRSLPTDYQRRLADLGGKCARILEIYQSSHADDFLLDTNRDALDRLHWLYLKLLVARHHLLTTASGENEASLAKRIAELEKELERPTDSEALRASKAATLEILKQRFNNSRRKVQTLEELDSDLVRIEAQADLILENVSMQGKPQTLSSDIQLASDLVGGTMFGDSETTIADLDRSYGKSNNGPARTREVS